MKLVSHKREIESLQRKNYLIHKKYIIAVFITLIFYVLINFIPYTTIDNIFIRFLINFVIALVFYILLMVISSLLFTIQNFYRKDFLSLIFKLIAEENSIYVKTKNTNYTKYFKENNFFQKKQQFRFASSFSLSYGNDKIDCVFGSLIKKVEKEEIEIFNGTILIFDLKSTNDFVLANGDSFIIDYLQDKTFIFDNLKLYTKGEILPYEIKKTFIEYLRKAIEVFDCEKTILFINNNKLYFFIDNSSPTLYTKKITETYINETYNIYIELINRIISLYKIITK